MLGTPSTEPLKSLYTVVRADLSPGSQIAQSCHAASEASGYPPTRVVSLAADNEDQIRAIDARLTALGVPHKLIIEEDGQAMAIGIEPTADLTLVKKAVSALRLCK